MAKNKNTINIIAGQEYQLRISEINDNLPNDFFYQTYEKAFNETKKIIKENSEEKSILESSNNIISFCGERGQGKSSAMLSFSKILENINSSSKYFDLTNSDIKDYKFHILRRIDPTELENNSSILSVIIARIFFDFKQEIEKSSKNVKLQNNIINNFQKCYRNINTIKYKYKDNCFNHEFEDDIETLSVLSDSANTKNDFHKLILDFLEFMFESNDKAMLVIQVDDTDLNVKRAYEIVEDIRKYFMMPNVLVLMAINIDLLTKAIDQEFRKSFDVACKDDKVSVKNTYEMSNQYVSKLMPGNRRIDLPKIKSVEYENINQSISVTYKSINSIGEKIDIYNFKNSRGKEITDLQEFVLRLIYEKTGLVFVKPTDKIHNIIPTNTRSFANFLSFLHALPDIKTDELRENCDINDMFRDYKDEKLNRLSLELIDTRISNLKDFRDYFLESFVKENLGNEIYEYYLKQIDLPDNDKISSTVRHYLADYFKSPSFSYENNMFSDLKNCKDIHNLLDFLKEIQTNTKNFEYQYIFDTEIFYSIVLNIWYCNQIKEYKLLQTYSEDRSIADFVGKIYNSFFGAISQDEYDKYGYTIKLSNDEYTDGLYLDENVESNLTSLFSELSAEITEEKYISSYNEEKINYIYKFNPQNIFLRLLEPPKLLKNNIIDDDYFCVTNFVFLICTNIDLINYILKKGNKKNNNSDYSVYLNNSFKLIESSINSLQYLLIRNVEISKLINIISEYGKWIEIIISKPYYINEYHNRLMEMLELLNPLYGKKTMEELQQDIVRFLNIMNRIFYLFPMINIQFETDNLKRLLTNADKIKKKGKKWSPKTCDMHRQEINKFIISAKEKCKYYIQEN